LTAPASGWYSPEKTEGGFVKKRYQVTLTESDVQVFQGHVKRLGLNPATLSLVVDDLIREMNKWFMKAQETGKLSMSDLFAFMGESIEQAMKEVREDAKPTPEAKKVEKRPSRKK
jgi:hypothetical protein